MKYVKKMVFVSLALMVSASFGALLSTSISSQLVKSKLGDIEVTSERGGGNVVCVAGFNDELKILKQADTEVLVRGKCGQGWVAKSKVEYVAKGPGDNSYTFDNLKVFGWSDNPTGVGIILDNVEDFEGVTIDRNFKEYLTYTMDRERTEMRNGEN